MLNFPRSTLACLVSGNPSSKRFWHFGQKVMKMTRTDSLSMFATKYANTLKNLEALSLIPNRPESGSQSSH